MKRRGAQHSSSLFAFQDVMASLIGIVFFVVLFMALDIVEQASPTGPPVDEPQRPDVAALREELKSLTDRRDQIELELARVTESLNVVSASSDADLVKEINALYNRILLLHEEIRQAENRLVRTDKARQETEVRVGSARAKASELDEALRRAKAIVQALRQRNARASRSAAGVTYLFDDTATTRKPWLVEVTGKSIRVAPHDDSDAVLTFSAQSAAARQKQFLAWTQSRRSSMYYFVLLAKPSGLSQIPGLKRELKRRGYSLGEDLLPENWEPFDQ